MSRPLRIGIVAGEFSGDLLGAGLLTALSARVPGASFEGIGGSGMIAAGCRTLFPMEKLSVMGFTEVLARYRELRGIQKSVIAHFLREPPDVFIGVDAPDFNLKIEETLRAAGIPTVHYVSPTVWAWRGYRIHQIRRAVDRMLPLFPFEADYYRAHGVGVTCVGHPMADEIPEHIDREAARTQLGLTGAQPIIALLPGSREGELKAHAPLFVQTAQWLHRRYPEMRFVVPFVGDATQDIFEGAVRAHAGADLPLHRFRGEARACMAAADIVVLASGTAALEAMLLKRPMVVTYKVSYISHLLIRLFSHVSLYSMPNNLAGYEIVPELMQDQATPERLGAAVEDFLRDPARCATIQEIFARLHRDLRRNANASAAAAVLATVAAAKGGRRETR